MNNQRVINPVRLLNFYQYMQSLNPLMDVEDHILAWEEFKSNPDNTIRQLFPVFGINAIRQISQNFYDRIWYFQL